MAFVSEVKGSLERVREIADFSVRRAASLLCCSVGLRRRVPAGQDFFEFSKDLSGFYCFSELFLRVFLIVSRYLGSFPRVSMQQLISEGSSNFGTLSDFT